MELSFPATALFTELRDTGELISREKFSEGFPEADYDKALEEAMEELKNKNLYPEPAGIFKEKESRRVRFHQLSSIPMRFD